MKSKQDVIKNLASNLELIMQDNGRKFLAFTTDYDNKVVANLVNDLNKYFETEKRKILVASYEDIKEDLDIKEDYYNIDYNKDTKESMEEKAKKYDCVVVICPNMLQNKSYLHMNSFVKDIVVIAKRWKSKTENLKTIKEICLQMELNILGIVFQN